MKIWEDFEIKCTNYLNERFGTYAHFFHNGGSDSTVSDILVKTNNGNSFYIDAKHSPAQCGQFVLLPDIETCTFEYSTKNTTTINIYTQKIIDYMNENFNNFREAGTSGKNINMPQGPSIFSNWIIQYYQEKGVDFFITNDYTILPVEKFKEYFNVSAKYRIKRSGSSAAGRGRIPLILNYLNSLDNIITNSHIDGNKLFIESTKNLHNQKFRLKQYEYMFSQRDEEYEIRKLSNTYNANVIFSIERDNRVPGLSDEQFINFLI